MKRFLKILVLQLCVLVGYWPPATAQNSRSGFRVREVNVYAPELYADKIDFVATLKHLPGAENKKSSWELSYQLFFIPEEKYYEALKTFPRGPANPTPEQFPGRILLAEGHKKRTHLDTLTQRTINLTGVPFKPKVPDPQRTKFALLMTAYSLKIFDAELKRTVYHTGIFLAEPYQEISQDQKQDVPRKTIYLNFGVNADGTLNGSQLPPKTSNASR
jgi:hypothetical protein